MKLTIANIFSDHMVLQHGRAIHIYGTCPPGAGVKGRFGDFTAEAAADTNGSWALEFPKMDPGGPYSLEISSTGETAALKDILIGDVWLCAGQSNMLLPMDRVRYTYPDEIESPYKGAVRVFSLPENPVFGGPAKDLPSGEWKCADPDTIAFFPAVGWFFGTTIHERVDIPVGIIVSAVGGTPIESWLPVQDIEEDSSLREEYESCCSPEVREGIQKRDQQALDAWNNELHENDPGLGGPVPWFDPSTEIGSWDDIDLPHKWKPEDDNLPLLPGRSHGSYWYSRDISLSKEFTNKQGLLRLGRIIDSDTAWINGVQVGTTGYQYPPRIYPIPPDLLKEGKNRITVRVVSGGLPPSFIPGKAYHIEVDGKTAALEGAWKYRRGAEAERIDGSARFVTKPVCLFNGMIAPLTGVGIRGVVWYQGESNTHSAETYGRALRRLIQRFRKEWHNPDLPVVIVQLPVYGSPSNTASESAWAQLRDIQRRTLEPGTSALAVTLDCGEWNDIHPLSKKPVGYRAAVEALKMVYGINDIPGCPLPSDVKREGDGVLIQFLNPGSGLIQTCNGMPVHLFIEGEDGEWKHVEPRLEPSALFIPSVPSRSFKVRYGWADNPAGACLYNREGFQASPFEITIPAK